MQKPDAWRVLPHAQAVAGAAAEWLVEKLGGIAARHAAAIALSGGTTPQCLYERLAQSPARDRIAWTKLHWFWCDERVVPADDPRSNFGMAQQLLFSRVPVQPANVHRVLTEDGTPQEVATAYEAELRRFYGKRTLDPAQPLFAVTLLGLGADGHTASLFPGSAVLDEHARWAAAVLDGPAEPRITLTYPALQSSSHLAFIVTGAGKRDIVHRIRSGDRDVPASRLRPVGEVCWFIDRAASGE